MNCGTRPGSFLNILYSSPNLGNMWRGHWPSTISPFLCWNYPDWSISIFYSPLFTVPRVPSQLKFCIMEATGVAIVQDRFCTASDNINVSGKRCELFEGSISSDTGRKQMEAYLIYLTTSKYDEVYIKVEQMATVTLPCTHALKALWRACGIYCKRKSTVLDFE